MRDIKFRFWNEQGKRFHHGPSQTLELLRQQATGLYDHEKDGCFIEQYIGIKDKFGREIYEGDTVKIYHVRLVADGPIHPPRLANVEWSVDECGFRMIGPDVKSTNPDLYPTSHLEVVGNIHEHNMFSMLAGNK